jgi:hypothetical protein
VLIFSLPTDILGHILSRRYLDSVDVFVCRFVCKLFCALLRHDGPSNVMRAFGSCKTHLTITQAAARHGYLSLLQWAVRFGYPMTGDILTQAAISCRLETVEWVLKRLAPSEIPHSWKHACEELAKRSEFQFLRRLHGLGAPLTPYAATLVAFRGDLNTLQWLYELPFKSASTDTIPRTLVSEHAALAAAQGGQLQVVQWLHSVGVKGDMSAMMAAAARRGHRHVLEWLWNHCNAEAVLARADSNICLAAAKRGDLPLLQWLRERDFQWNVDTYVEARRRNHQELLHWAVQNSVPLPPHQAPATEAVPVQISGAQADEGGVLEEDFDAVLSLSSLQPQVPPPPVPPTTATPVLMSASSSKDNASEESGDEESDIDALPPYHNSA